MRTLFLISAHVSSPRRLTRALRACLGMLAALGAFAPSAHATAPGDVYYVANVFQKFKYYVFVNDEVIWANSTYSGTSLAVTASRDSFDALGTYGTHNTLSADAGTLRSDFGSNMTLSARTGVFHQAYSDLTLDVYLRGATGTPYTITEEWTGQLDASRLGGLPGSLQGVNGISEAYVENMIANVPNGGVLTVPLDSIAVYKGVTTTQILVNGETYSLARQFVYNSRTSISQALCILGCMTQAADFNAVADAHLTLSVFPTNATAVADAPATHKNIALSAAAGDQAIAFRGSKGAPSVVDAFDLRGRHVARVFEGTASGETQSIRWNAGGAPRGTYVLRATSGDEVATAKVALLR